MIDLLRHKYLFKNFSAFFGASLIPMALGLIANPFIAMNMSAEDYAITGYFTSFASLLTPVITFYFLQYYIKRYFECNEEQRTELKAALCKLLTVYSLIAGIVCMCGVLAYIKVFNSDIQFDIFPYLPLAIMVLPLTGLLNLELADYKMARDTKSFFILSVVAGTINVIVLVLMVVVMKLGALGKMLAPFLVNAGLFAYLLFRHRQLWKFKVSMSYYSRLFKFCWPLAGAAMLGYFTNGFDKTFLESLGDTEEYGYYCVGASIATYLQVFSAAIANTFQPDIYESIVKKDNRRLLKIFSLQICSLLLVLIVFIIFCPVAVYVLTAGRFMGSVPYARILSIAMLTSTLYFNANCVTIARGYPRLSLYTSVVGSIIIVLLMPVIAGRWQYTGGAWMSVFSYIILLLVNILILGINTNKINKSH